MHSSYLEWAVRVHQAPAGFDLDDPIKHSQQFHKEGISETRKSELSKLPDGPARKGGAEI